MELGHRESKVSANWDKGLKGIEMSMSPIRMCVTQIKFEFSPLRYPLVGCLLSEDYVMHLYLIS